MNAFADHSDILQQFNAYSHFIPISVSLLTESTSARFPVFVADWDAKEFLLFCDEGKPFHPQHLKILTDNGQIPVFIPVEYSQQVNKELSNNLISVVEDDSLPIEEKTERFHTLSTLILKSLFDSPPRIETFIETASVVSDTMAILLSSGPEVIGTLQNLRSFDYYTDRRFLSQSSGPSIRCKYESADTGRVAA